MAKKILKRSLALGALMAFVITGSAMAEDYGKKSISSEQILGNANEDLKINYNARGGLSNDFGIRFYLPSRASKEINPSVIGSNISINIYNNGTPYEQIINGIYSYAANKTVGGTLYVGNNETKSISINVNAEGLANGIYLKGVEDKHGTKVVIDSENLTIDSNSDTSYSRAIYVGNNTTDLNGKNPVTLVINSDNTIINSTAKVKVDETDGDNHAIGISALSQGVVEINGSVEINADTVLSTRGGAITKINAANDSTRTVKLNGDIDFNYSNTTDVDADVTINLANVDSVFNGKISVTGNPPVGMAQVNGMNISFSNGAA